MQDFFQHIINGLALGSIYALIALGYTMVYGILQLINFAHSEVYMVGAFTAYYLAVALGIQTTPGWESFVILTVGAMLACALLGMAIERLAYRPLRSAPKLNVLITAIGVSLLLQYSGQLIFGAEPKVFPTILENSVILQWDNVRLSNLDLAVLATTLVAMLGLRTLVFHTRMGKAMRAVSQNPRAAVLMGIPLNRTVAFAFAIGSALAGIGAILVGMKYPKIEPLMGMMIGMKAFVAAVMGGIGSLPGAVVGGILMGVSEGLVVAYLSSTYRDAFAFGILIVILVFMPTGLFGSRQTEKV